MYPDCASECGGGRSSLLYGILTDVDGITRTSSPDNRLSTSGRQNSFEVIYGNRVPSIAISAYHRISHQNGVDDGLIGCFHGSSEKWCQMGVVDLWSLRGICERDNEISAPKTGDSPNSAQSQRGPSSDPAELPCCQRGIGPDHHHNGPSGVF